MSYYQIQDFKGGLDSRRMEETSDAGTLAKALNCHITRGGEIEKALAWGNQTNLPTGTYGLAQAKDQLTVFGSISTPAGMPASVDYQQLVHPQGHAMTAVLATDTFDDRHYVVAKFQDDSIVHFYDGQEVDFNPTAHIRFKIEATAAGSVTSLTVDTTELLAASATWASASESAAQALADKINANKATSGFEAIRDGVYVIVFATAVNLADNGKSVVITWTGADVDAHSDTDSPYTIGTAEGAAEDVQSLGHAIRTYGQKVYTGVGSILFFTPINDPTQYYETTLAIGAGFINLGNQASGTRDIAAISEYADQMAIFSRQDIQIWSMSEDPSTNIRIQTLVNTGTIAPDSVVSFGDLDVFYLSPSGIRSLKSRDQTNAAFASDVGTAIDNSITALIRNSPATVKAAKGILEPIDGRYMLAIGTEAYVFSYFPASKISAWSTYSLPGQLEARVQTPENLYIRVGNSIYQLGGSTRTEYDDTAVVVETPFLDGDKPATYKSLHGIDIACEGTWKIEVCFDPTNPDVFEEIAQVEGTTYFNDAFGAIGRATMFRFRFTSLNDGYARIGGFVFHFQEEVAD